MLPSSSISGPLSAVSTAPPALPASTAAQSLAIPVPLTPNQSGVTASHAIPSTSPFPVLNIMLGSPVNLQTVSPTHGSSSISEAVEGGPGVVSFDRSNGAGRPQEVNGNAEPLKVLNIDVSDENSATSFLPSLQVQSDISQELTPSQDYGILSILVSGSGTFCKPLTFKVPHTLFPNVFISLRATVSRDTEFYGKTLLSIRDKSTAGATACIEFLGIWPVGYSPKTMRVHWIAAPQSNRSGTVTFDLARPAFMERLCEHVKLTGRGSLNAPVGPLSVIHSVEWLRSPRSDHSIVSWVEESHEGSFLICITDINPSSSLSHRDGYLQVSWMLASAAGGKVGARPRGRKPACVEVDAHGAGKRVVVVSPGYGRARERARFRNGAAVAWVERQEGNVFVACVKRLDSSIADEEDLDIAWESSSIVPDEKNWWM